MTTPKDASDRWQKAARAVSPKDALITCLEITHPNVAQPVRAANDVQQRIVDGETYYPVRFQAQFADSVEGRVPRATMRMDNVGSILTQWIDASDGGSEAQIRVFQVAASFGEPSGGDSVEWETVMDVTQMRYDQESAYASLGFEPLLERPAVQQLHDPNVSPGLF